MVHYNTSFCSKFVVYNMCRCTYIHYTNRFSGPWKGYSLCMYRLTLFTFLKIGFPIIGHFNHVTVCSHISRLNWTLHNIVLYNRAFSYLAHETWRQVTYTLLQIHFSFIIWYYAGLQFHCWPDRNSEVKPQDIAEWPDLPHKHLPLTQLLWWWWLARDQVISWNLNIFTVASRW